MAKEFHSNIPRMIAHFPLLMVIEWGVFWSLVSLGVIAYAFTSPFFTFGESLAEAVEEVLFIAGFTAVLLLFTLKSVVLSDQGIKLKALLGPSFFIAWPALQELDASRSHSVLGPLWVFRGSNGLTLTVPKYHLSKRNESELWALVQAKLQGLGFAEESNKQFKSPALRAGTLRSAERPLT